MKKSLKIIIPNEPFEINTFMLKSSDGLDIPAYMVLPLGTGKIPCVITASAGIHGSIFIKRSKKIDPFHLKWLRFFYDNGIAVLFIEKRGSRGYGRDFFKQNEIAGNEILDVLAGINFLLKNKRINSKKIYCYGVSRITIPFFWAALKSRRLNGIILQAGFYELRSQLEKMDNKYVRQLTGKYNLRDFPYEKRSPIYFIDKFPKNTRVLIIHSPDDEKVDYNQSVRLYKEMLKKKLQVKLVLMKEIVHLKSASQPGTKSGNKLARAILNFI